MQIVKDKGSRVTRRRQGGRSFFVSNNTFEYNWDGEVIKCRAKQEG